MRPQDFFNVLVANRRRLPFGTRIRALCLRTSRLGWVTWRTSIQTTERYLGTRQDLVHAPNDGIS